MPDPDLKHQTFAALRERLGVCVTGDPLPVPVKGDDFPGHLLKSGLHEIVMDRSADQACALAFALAAARGAKPVLLVTLSRDVTEGGQCGGAGLAQLGLDPRKYILVDVRDEKHLLWAAEEGAGCPALGGVIACLGAREKLYGFTASRRLKLRQEVSGVPVFMLRRMNGEATAATARWHIGALSSRGIPAGAALPLVAQPQFTVRLERYSGRPPQSWEIEFDETHGLRVPAPVFDRPAGANDEHRRAA